MISSSPVCRNDKLSRRMEILDLGRAGSSTQWRGTATMGAPGAGRKVGVLPPAVLKVAAEVPRDTFQGVLLEASQDRPITLCGLCRGAPQGRNHPSLARGHPPPCKRMIKIIKISTIRCHIHHYLVSNGCDLKVVNSFDSSFNLSSTNGIFLMACGER